jgi:hypothetical protein
MQVKFKKIVLIVVAITFSSVLSALVVFSIPDQNQYNQTQTINITGNASTTDQSTINNYLNTNSDSLTWGVTEAEVKTAPLRNSTMGGDTGSDAWVTSVTVAKGTAAYGYDSTNGNPSPSYYHKATSSAGSAANIAFYTNQSFNYTLGTPGSVVLSWDYSTSGNSIGSSILQVILFKPDGSSVVLDTLSFSSAIAWTTRTVNVDVGNFIQSGTYKIQLYSSLVAGAKGTSNWLQASWDNVYLNFTHYQLSVEHNATGVSYSGTLNSINVSINFTSTVDDIYNMTIYNFASSSWDASSCQYVSVTANNYYTIWCHNKSGKLQFFYRSSKGKVKFNY